MKTILGLLAGGLLAMPAPAQTVTPWQIHDGDTRVTVTGTALREWKALFKLASIPAADTQEWKPAPSEHEIGLNAANRSTHRHECAFTYAQAFVSLPSLGSTCQLRILRPLDRAVRVVIQNARYPNGWILADIAKDHAAFRAGDVVVELHPHLVAGVTRVLLVHADIGAEKSKLSARIEWGGQLLAFAPDPVACVRTYLRVVGLSEERLARAKEVREAAIAAGRRQEEAVRTQVFLAQLQQQAVLQQWFLSQRMSTSTHSYRTYRWEWVWVAE